MTPRRVRVGAALVLALGLLGTDGCGSAGQPSPVTPGPQREHWELSHRVPETAGWRVASVRLDDYSETTEASYESGAPCSVTVSVPGWGGPENKVGEQVAAQVRGRPALTNGAGAEGDYLMWQRTDGQWTETGCEGSDQRDDQQRLADHVVDEPTTIAVPFDATSVPAGLDVDGIAQDVSSGVTTVRLSGARSTEGLVLTYDDERFQKEGRPTLIATHPAQIDENPRDPGVCLTVQGHDVCVVVDSDDTGPYPDRSGELPLMLTVAQGLRFPTDLGDRTSWFDADGVFG